MDTKIRWDEAKRQLILTEQGIDILDAALIFEKPEDILIDYKASSDSRDTRYHAIGRSDNTVYFVAFELGRNCDNAIFLTNVERPDEKSKRKYENRLAKRASKQQKSR